MYTMNDFIKSKIAVYMTNEEDVIEFLQACEKSNLRWRDGRNPTDMGAFYGENIRGGITMLGYDRDGICFGIYDSDAQMIKRESSFGRTVFVRFEDFAPKSKFFIRIPEVLAKS